LALLATLVLAAPVGAEPRLAQAVALDVLPPYEIATIIRSTGLDPVGRPVLRGADYVLRAIAGDGGVVRVVVDARSGEIVSVTPVETASRRLPRGVTMGPYEPVPPGYVPPALRDLDGSGPPEFFERPPPATFGRRPPAPVPEAPPPARAGVPAPIIFAAPSDRPDLATGSAPQVITAIEPGESGLLPPPPERFPKRAPPAAATPKPAKRAVASVPKQAPLPKPRPAGSAGAASTPSAAQDDKAAAVPVPH
jgi:hypothetical protein